jgi:hypothetical protein
MHKINTLIVGGTAALLLATAPMLASANEGNTSVKASASVHGNTNPGLHLGSLLHFGTKTGKSEDRKDEEKKGEHNKPAHATSTAEVRRNGVGVVTSITGSTFTLTPLGKTNATTTVSTGTSTVYTLNGTAATSSALAVGTHVIVTGTKNAGATISASIVGIFTDGWSFVAHLFH